MKKCIQSRNNGTVFVIIPAVIQHFIKPVDTANTDWYTSRHIYVTEFLKLLNESE